MVTSIINYFFFMTENRHSTYSYSADSTLPYFKDSPSRRDLDGTRRNSNLPLFDLRTIIAATNNFSIANKLGQGGFGPVYKVVSLNKSPNLHNLISNVFMHQKFHHECLLQNGMEIAVKRLSKCSRQGIEQFKTEVALIAKLQHRNLVRILGCCIHKEEKLLIYEYLPNKSLDSFIFDETKRSCLDWGIIVGGDQIEANTNCVVGTYFGVLLLEIVTGKKNNTYHHDGPSSNLIGHVWDLWREDNSMKIVDPLLDETYPANEISRCIQIRLLCVQEHATDRPTMPTVVFMLGNDTHLPSPKRPAFILMGINNSTDRSANAASNSINEITLSQIDGR
ncbi:hypothetical protein CMV_027807 [Castanea mollissima]|uniref:Protein kinase domain-containing protein n=1 Tax=Castanea mollissima TaxID=60419 RepID=A0A8J4Q9R1_9ROSI|nr:hypothetical protein CMV_027807 [Castanea mollissima]